MRYLVIFSIALFMIAVFGPPIVSHCLNTSDRLVCSLGAAAFAAEDEKEKTEEPAEDTPKLVRSKRERRVERRTNWVEGLTGDKAKIYSLYGYPSGKYREEVMGTIVERWVYPEHGVTFKFKGSTLTR